MPKSCIFKIILGGASRSGKTTFINGDSTYDTNDFFHIGVSFKLIECTINDRDSYLMQIWDLKAVDRFQCLYPGFIKGAKAAILTFDMNNKQSFREIPTWIEMITEQSLQIPIILIGTKSDLKHRVSDHEIIELMEKYNIPDFYMSAMDVDKRGIVIKRIIEHISKIRISKFRMQLPQKDEDFKQFWSNFSQCPICHRENHINYIKNFFFSTQTESIVLRNQLLELLEKYDYIQERHSNQIQLGIPCCKCYEKIFPKN